MQHSRRHDVVWTLLQPLARLILWIKFRYTAKVNDIKGPCLVLSNHNTDLDPLMVAVAFKHQMHFVASEHIFRQGFVSKLLMWLQAPIARQKGGSAAGTVKTMIRTVRDGHSVGLFPEGNRSWDGVTHEVTPSTGKLAKTCGGTLVTFRLKGGYFASPRWAGTRSRRGRCTGEVVGVYTPEQIKTMSVSEINDVIRRDLYEDAYEAQKAAPVRFKGSRLAENLETLLFVCPECGKMHTLKSEGDRFFCTSCGMELKFTEAGFFEGEKLRFDNIRDWNEWQNERIRELCDGSGDEAIFTDDEIELREIHTAESAKVIARGSLTLYRDRLVLPDGREIRLENISGMALRGPVNLFIGTSEGESFEARPQKVRNTLKYLTACTMLGCPVEFGI